MNAYHNFGAYAPVDGYGLLVALQVDTSAIDIKWSDPFNGPSAASPVVMPVSGGPNSAIYFDGHGMADPLLYKITDTGTGYTANWVSTTGDFATRIPASVTVDSARNCVWAFAVGSTTLNCVDQGATYAIDYTIDTSRFSSGFPASDMTMTTTSDGHNVLILGLELIGENPGKILAIELVPSGSYFGTEYWIFALPGDAEFSAGQFPIITDGSGSYLDIAFPSVLNRLYMYGN